MPRVTTLLLLFVALTAGGCEAPPPFSTDPAEEVDRLEFTLPIVSRSGLPAATPQGTDRPAPASMDLEAHARPLQQVRNPRTRVELNAGHVFALGIHDYIGNIGAIETSVEVTFEDKYLGSFRSEKQSYTPFMFDFGLQKSIWAQAKVFTDHTCGLTVNGSSVHRASWQFYQGRSAPLWGESRRTTQASPKSQRSCENQVGRTEITETRPTGMVCTYLITYDLSTGEWLRAELLFCSSVGGGLI